MMKTLRLNRGSMTLMSWEKCVVGCHYGLLGTSKGCAGTTSVICDPGNYSRETWYSARFKISRA